MVIIKFDIKSETSELLFEGSLDEVILAFNEITETFEQNGEFMINEINVGKEINSITIIREFATESNGQIFDLIVCGGMALNINPNLLNGKS